MGELGLKVAVRVAGWVDSVEESLMVAEKVGFCDAELKIQDIEVLSLNTTHIPLAENTSTKCPVHVLQCGIVKVLKETQ